MEILPGLHKSQNRRCRGFSFLEILIAISIIAIASAGLFGAFTQASRYSQPQQPTAYNAAQTQLENLYQTLGAATWPPANPSSSTITLTPTTYTHNVVVTDMTAQGKEYKKVTVTTSW